jgi:hypothetical protein
MTKTKFFILTILLLLLRVGDFYSTSLWFFQENGMKNETNPLTRLFGVGWAGLIIANIVIVGTTIGLLYYYFFRYKRPTNFTETPENYKELASLQYFGKTGKFYQIFYKVAKNKRVLAAHLGYVLTIVFIVGSLLATIHNFSQYYEFKFYDQFRQLVGRPLYVIYLLIAITLFLAYRSLLKKEYEKYKISRNITW